MGLIQGSPLTISRHNSTSLLITVDKNIGGGVIQNEKRLGSLYISKPEPAEIILNKIVCLYVQGYNMIKVRLSESSSSSFLKSTIRELVRRQLIGIEIVSDNSDGLVLQILLGKSELTIDNAMKRMSIVASSMLEDAISALRFADKRRARDVLEKDEIERFGSYTSRQILGSLSHDFFKEGDDFEPEKLMAYLMISRSIENVARCTRDVVEQALRMEFPLHPSNAEELGKVGAVASDIFDSSVLSFFKRDSRAAEITVDRGREFVNLVGLTVKNSRGRTSESLPTEENIALISALESLKTVVHHSAEISNLVLSLTSDQFVRNELPVQAIGGELMLERDQLSVYSQ